MHSIEEIEVEGSPMEVFLFDPPAGATHPAIILAQHIPVGHTGIENDTFTLKAAERLCEKGYTVAVPFIFHWWAKEEDLKVKRDESRDDRMVADMKATFELLKNKQQVDDQRIAIVGHCWGGRVAWLGACHIPQLAACAIFYGGRIKLSMGDNSPPAIDLAHQINCPVAGFFGNEDRNPTPEDVDDYQQALESAGVVHEFHRYDGAGHAFQNFPSEERYRQTQSEDAWLKLFNFLSHNLQSN